MATCQFCKRKFKNAQAVRAHLRGCQAYQGSEPKAKPKGRTAYIGRTVPQAPEENGDDYALDTERLVRTEEQPWSSDQGSARTPKTEKPEGKWEKRARQQMEAWRQERQQAERQRAAREAEERRRKEEAERLRKRQLAIQRVKDRVIGNWWSFRHTIPSETRARAYQEIQGALSALPVEDLPESELVAIAEGVRYRLYRPIMTAQDEAKRVEEQRRREEQQRVLEGAQRTASKEELLGHGNDYACSALEDVEDLDPRDRETILRRVERALERELAGDESEDDVEDLVEGILEEEGIE